MYLQKVHREEASLSDHINTVTYLGAAQFNQSDLPARLEQSGFGALLTGQGGPPAAGGTNRTAQTMSYSCNLVSV